MKEFFLLVDVGASFLKVALLDVKSGRYRNVRQVPFPKFLKSKYGFKEVDPKRILKIFVALLKESLGVQAKCHGILLSTQMHGFILCDSQGNALSNFISWQDTRSESALELLTRSEIKEMGNELRPGMALCNLVWLKENKLLTRDAYPITIADFLICNINSSRPKIHNTNAASFGGFSLKKMIWEKSTIDKLGLNFLNWPEIVGHNSPVSYLQIDEQKIPCYPAVGDQQAALLGVGLKKNELSINIGTGSQIAIISKNLEHGDYQLRPFFDNNFIKTITHIPAGRALNALFDLVSELSDNKSREEIWKYINIKTQRLRQVDLQVDLSFFPSATGNYGFVNNIKESNLNIASLFRASYQAMADQYYILSERLSKSNFFDKVILSGGLVQKNRVLNKMIRERFSEKKVILTKNSIETLDGLKILSLNL